MHHRFPLIIAFLTLCLVASGAAAEETAQGGLERLLHGARIGTAFGAFVEAHPEAVYSDEEKRPLPVLKDAPGPLLIVHTEDPFLGLYQFANFGFKEDRLYEMVAVWSGEPEEVGARRRRFFTAIIKRHGHVYQRKSMRVFPGTPEERAVAVFYWEDKDAVTLAFHTPPSTLDNHPRGTLTYAQFKPGDPFLTDILTSVAATPEQHEQAWKDMADVVDALEAD